MGLLLALLLYYRERLNLVLHQVRESCLRDYIGLAYEVDSSGQYVVFRIRDVSGLWRGQCDKSVD